MAVVKIRRKNFSRGVAGQERSSVLIYVKLFLLWAVVLLADHFLDFRFEYLWPFCMFLGTLYDTCKYKGMPFSAFFVCITITSDMICFLFIPVPWLFFVASTYVWVQFVCHTDRGLCIPSILLWVLLVYIEASMRLKEFRFNIDHKQLPFHLDLCRPFAAHCIGYPVVSLGYDFKGYVAYQLRNRRQRKVQSMNAFYFQVLEEALPAGLKEDLFSNESRSKICSDEKSANGNAISFTSQASISLSPGDCPDSGSSSELRNGCLDIHGSVKCSSVTATLPTTISTATTPKTSNGSTLRTNGISTGSNGYLDNIEKVDFEDKRQNKVSTISNKDASKRYRDASKSVKDDPVNQNIKTEAELKKCKFDLQIARIKENELRDQIATAAASERILKSEISNLQAEKSLLESRVSNLISTRAGEKATLSLIEKKLAEEKKQKTEFQTKLEAERKIKREAANAERTVQQNQNRNEVAKLEAEMKSLRKDLQLSRNRLEVAELEVYTLKQYKEVYGDPEILAKVVEKLKDKNAQLETSLSAETKLKMDLFSALGEAKRQFSIVNASVTEKDKYIFELKAKITDLLAVMPVGVVASARAAIGSGRRSNAMNPHNSLSFNHSSSGDQTYGRKTSSLGLSDLENKLTSGIYSTAAQLVNSTSFPAAKNNGINKY